MFRKVFISHAKEDYYEAEKIYEFLKWNNYLPWLDKKELKVGANWDYEIKKALKESTFVILLLSSTSVKKRGYVQKEFKYAIEYAESKLVDDIYIIPLLIDECVVPEQLSRFQWIKLEDYNILEQVLISLNYQRDKYLLDVPSEMKEINDFSTISIDLKLEVPLKIDYNCAIPLFNENKFFDAHFVNTFIQQKVLAYLSETGHWLNADSKALENHDFLYLDISYNIKNLDEKYLSMSIIYDSFLGGAHPSTSIDTLNFSFNPERSLQFREIADYTNLKQYLDDKIDEYGDDDQIGSLKRYTEYLGEESINFVFDDKVIEINFMNEIPRVILAMANLEIPRK